jgi:hypothetical protein
VHVRRLLHAPKALHGVLKLLVSSESQSLPKSMTLVKGSESEYEENWST